MAVKNILGTYKPDADGKVKEQTPLVPEKLKPFPKLEGQWLKEITGEVVANPESREVKSGLWITNFDLTDGKRKLRVGIWGDQGLDLEVESGDVVTLTDMKIGQYQGVDQDKVGDSP